jgi:hypothetical protein
MKQALKVSVEGTTEVVDLDAPEGSLKVLQEAVGGWVEAVDLNDEVTLWCNEEGKLEGLPTHPSATRFFQAAFNTQDWIAGNIILTGGVDDEGDTLGLTDEQIQKYSFILRG